MGIDKHLDLALYSPSLVAMKGLLTFSVLAAHLNDLQNLAIPHSPLPESLSQLIWGGNQTVMFGKSSPGDAEA